MRFFVPALGRWSSSHGRRFTLVRVRLFGVRLPVAEVFWRYGSPPWPLSLFVRPSAAAWA